jgi:DNA-directed RNA polymerase alpha subunit
LSGCHFTPSSDEVHVENARVGDITDYDRLIMEIWTMERLRADALAYSAKILKDHLFLFIHFPMKTKRRWNRMKN